MRDSSERRPQGHRAYHSIFWRTLIRVGLGLAVVAVAGTALIYFHVFATIEARAIETLRAYIQERGHSEEAVFALAENNHKVLRVEILRRLEALGGADPKEPFERLFVRQADGIIRNRPERFNGTKMSGVCIDAGLTIDADIRRRVLTFYELTNAYGPAWHNHFQDTYITTPENIMVIYWPEVPDWCQQMDTSLYMPDEEYVWVADAEHNPARKTVWTGVFYDHVSDVWMVSGETPVYEDERQIATIGHDIVLNELLSRALKDRLAGSYNIVLRQDGRLIVHPKLMDEIKRRGGYYDILEVGDAHLRGVFEATREGGNDKAFVVRHPSADEYLAVTRLQGIDWYFITVYPRAILTDLAFDSARIVLFLAALALLLQGAVLFFIMQRQMARPLRRLISATERVEAGDYKVSLDLQRRDEFGQLAEAFNSMTERVRERDNELAEVMKQLEQRVKQRTAQLETAWNAAVQAAKEAEAANRSKSAFLANMSHEIRTPMNAILGFTEILAGSISDAQQKQYLKSIQTSGKSLLTLINDILDLSKVEAGKLELEYCAVDPRGVFMEMEQVFAQKMAEKNLDFSVELSPELPPALVLDEVRIRQILINLIGNAVKFTERGYIKLSAWSQHPAQEGSRLDLVFKVEDTGKGIPEDQQESIFGAFEQLAGQNINEYGGTGLGLAICRRLVELMGGDIQVRSSVGRGSTFQVTLRGVPVAAVSEVAFNPASTLDLDAITFAPATILIADDLAINRNLVQGYLDAYGFTLLEAENGVEAVEVALRHRPDLVLMDMKMPVMNGYEAAIRIKSEAATREIPVVALTASAMGQAADEIRSACDGYLRKPVSKADLVSELAQFLPHTEREAEPEVTEETAADGSDAALDAAVWQRLPELARALEEAQVESETLRHTMAINDIEAFAQRIGGLGAEYSYPPLVSWGERLTAQVTLFDLDGISNSLASYPELIQHIKSLSPPEAPESDPVGEVK